MTDEVNLHHSRCDYIMHRDRRLFQKVSIKRPEQYDTDHHMLVARFLVQPTRFHKAYLLGRKKFPLKLPTENLTEADRLWNVVKAQMPPLAPQQRRPLDQPGFRQPPSGSWISDVPYGGVSFTADCEPDSSPGWSTADTRSTDGGALKLLEQP